jgi:two-component system response regulator MprA
VDDDRALACMLAMRLEDAGHKVSVAHSCREAHALIAAGGFEIALLDYQLPDGTGLDLAAPLRDQDPCTLIIVMSGAEDSDLEARIHTLGIPHFLPKPLDCRALERIIRPPRPSSEE